MLWPIALLAFAGLGFKAYRNTFHPTINRISIDIPREKRHINGAFPPIRILHLSDLHMENISIKPEGLVADLADEALDLIAITGDFLDRAYNIPKAISFVEQLQQLSPRLGTFVVFGNHDYLLPAAKLDLLQRELEGVGCRVLRNETVTLDAADVKLHVIGVDDYATRHSDLAKSFQQVPGDGLRLVLTHDPNVVLEMQEYDYDYLLSGHFHGGQIHWPKPFHLAKMGQLPRMNIVKGLHYLNGRPFYISEGLGQTGLNVRLRSRPEITVHTLQSQPAPQAQKSGVSVSASREKASVLATSEI
jgi:hypothetical protein